MKEAAARLGEGIRLRKAELTIALRRQFMDLQATIARDEDLANLYQRGLRGFTGLSDTEQTRFFIISRLPPAICQPRARRQQYSTKLSSL